jgi:hypothetical protein
MHPPTQDALSMKGVAAMQFAALILNRCEAHDTLRLALDCNHWKGVLYLCLADYRQWHLSFFFHKCHE